MTATARDPETPKRGRLWLFRTIAVLIGLTPLILGEVALRTFDVARPSLHDDPFVGFSAVHPLFVLDDMKVRYVIPPARQLFFRPESFAARKSPREYRIFCLGGSTVQGRPFAIETSFTTWLEINLNAADPSRIWEVVNCGGVSYASYRLAPIVEEILHYRPDLIILLTGHNEFLEDRTYQPIKTLSWPARPALELASRLRLFVLFRELVQRFWGPTREPADAEKPLLPEEVDTILDYQGGLASYHRDESWRRDVIAHFGYNLGRMIGMARDRGVPVILVNPIANLETPPFKSEHRRGLSDVELQRFEDLWNEARGLYGRDLPLAVEFLKQARAIDDQHAGLLFSLGKCEQELARFSEARESLSRAKEEDVCPLRILEPMNQTILDVGRVTRTPVVDLVPLFESLSHGGILGYDWLVDHVHPSIQGHRRIAQALFDQMVDMGIVHPSGGWESERDRRQEAHLASLDSLYFLKGEQRLERLQMWTQGLGVKAPQRPWYPRGEPGVAPTKVPGRSTRSRTTSLSRS